MQLLNTPDDMQWLAETHLKTIADKVMQCGSAILYGNESGPDKVELYESSDPMVSDPIIYTWHYDNEPQSNIRADMDDPADD